MKPLKILLLTIVTLFAVTGCCWTDHSKEIKKIAEPMAKELEAFYKKEKRFPTRQERDEMLEKVGCGVKGDVCRYDGSSITVESDAIGNDYNTFMEKGNTYCFFYLGKNGAITLPKCRQNPCIELGQ